MYAIGVLTHFLLQEVKLISLSRTWNKNNMDSLKF